MLCKCDVRLYLQFHACNCLCSRLAAPNREVGISPTTRDAFVARHALWPGYDFVTELSFVASHAFVTRHALLTEHVFFFADTEIARIR